MTSAPALPPRSPASRDAPRPGQPLLLGFSGGLDSSVLLHLLAADPATRSAGLRALHVHHGLQPQADAWAAHCERECAALGVPFRVVRVTVDRGSGLGIEAAARAARHAAFAATLEEDAILALAQHRDDQAETFLLRALRGSGVDGLGAMRPWRRFHRGYLWRPLLATPRAGLLDYATQHGLRWIDDPSNEDTRFDRNFIRSCVMPLLRERWPHADAAFANSAQHCDSASRLLHDLDRAHLEQVLLGDPARISCHELLALRPELQARVLRLWVRELRLPPLSDNGVRRVLAEVAVGRPDRLPRFVWQGAQITRWRDVLHAGRVRAPHPEHWSHPWDGSAPLDLPEGGKLELDGVETFDAPIQVRTRRGGERIRLPGRPHSSSLKHLLQEHRMPPWERWSLPILVDADGEILAAGDAILSDRLSRWLGARPDGRGRIVWHRG